MKCSASWLLELDETNDWPSGDWVHCPTEAEQARVLVITNEVLIMLRFCPAHAELFDEANIGKSPQGLEPE